MPAPRSPILRTASLAVATLVLVIGWRIAAGSGAEFARPLSALPAAAAAGGLPSVSAPDGSGVATSDIALVGTAVVGELVGEYRNLKASGSYSPEAAAAAAETFGEQIAVPVPYKTYASADIKTTGDNSYSAMLAYRSSLQEALAPLVSVKDLELAVFAKYAATKDPAYLDALRGTVAAYASSTAAAAALTVPSDAVGVHLGILNAMGRFSASLSALADNAGDPITVITLLKTYQSAEGDMLTSFNDLAAYFANHPKP